MSLTYCIGLYCPLITAPARSADPLVEMFNSTGHRIKRPLVGLITVAGRSVGRILSTLTTRVCRIGLPPHTQSPIETPSDDLPQRKKAAFETVYIGVNATGDAGDTSPAIFGQPV